MGVTFQPSRTAHKLCAVGNRPTQVADSVAQRLLRSCTDFACANIHEEHCPHRTSGCNNLSECTVEIGKMALEPDLRLLSVCFLLDPLRLTDSSSRACFPSLVVPYERRLQDPLTGIFGITAVPNVEFFTL